MTNFIFKKHIYQIQVRRLHCLVCPLVPNLTDVTQVCKNANWKIVDVATVVNVATDEERINDCVVEKLKFGQNIKAEFFVTFF